MAEDNLNKIVLRNSSKNEGLQSKTISGSKKEISRKPRRVKNGDAKSVETGLPIDQPVAKKAKYNKYEREKEIGDNPFNDLSVRSFENNGVYTFNTPAVFQQQPHLNFDQMSPYHQLGVFGTNNHAEGYEQGQQVTYVGNSVSNGLYHVYQSQLKEEQQQPMTNGEAFVITAASELHGEMLPNYKYLSGCDSNNTMEKPEPSLQPIRNSAKNAASCDNNNIKKTKRSKRRRIITQSQRSAANIRERKRMLSMNDAFDELRKHLPSFSYEKRLSRIETLRLSIIYISFMADLLKGNKDPKDVKIKNLKHGWNSSKSKHSNPTLPRVIMQHMMKKKSGMMHDMTAQSERFPPSFSGNFSNFPLEYYNSTAQTTPTDVYSPVDNSPTQHHEMLEQHGQYVKLPTMAYPQIQMEPSQPLEPYYPDYFHIQHPQSVKYSSGDVLEERMITDGLSQAYPVSINGVTDSRETALQFWPVEHSPHCSATSLVYINNDNISINNTYSGEYQECYQ